MRSTATGIIIFLFISLGFSQQNKKTEMPVVYKSLSDSCFSAGDVILTSFLVRGKTATEIKTEALNELAKFLQKHKNLVAEIKFRKKSALQKNTLTEIQTKLLSEPNPGNISFTFADPNDNPDYIGPYTGKTRAVAVVKEKEEIKTEIKILKPLTFPWNKQRTNKKPNEFLAGDVLKMPEILYDLGKAGLREGSKDSLKKWAKFITDHPEFIFSTTNHTDTRGKDILNMQLSELRAKCCYDYLVNELKIPKERLYYKGYGESQLIVTDDEVLKTKIPEEKEVLHQKNRRTELRIIGYSGDCGYLYNP
ncbi:MAG: OmpA family protein [Bacteroidia bacterium]|nr:OmpA family protein [Bacteroidia bacterium]